VSGVGDVHGSGHDEKVADVKAWKPQYGGVVVRKGRQPPDAVQSSFRIILEWIEREKLLNCMSFFFFSTVGLIFPPSLLPSQPPRSSIGPKLGRAIIGNLIIQLRGRPGSLPGRPNSIRPLCHAPHARSPSPRGAMVLSFVCSPGRWSFSFMILHVDDTFISLRHSPRHWSVPRRPLLSWQGRCSSCIIRIAVLRVDSRSCSRRAIAG